MPPHYPLSLSEAMTRPSAQHGGRRPFDDELGERKFALSSYPPEQNKKIPGGDSGRSATAVVTPPCSGCSKSGPKAIPLSEYVLGDHGECGKLYVGSATYEASL